MLFSLCRRLLQESTCDPRSLHRVHVRFVLWLVRVTNTCKAFVSFNFVCLPQKRLDLCYKAIRTRFATIFASLKLWLELLGDEFYHKVSP